MSAAKEEYRAARYARLSREDGDKPESDSIVNQLRLMEDYCARHPEIELAGDYTDDGFTGTNFDRPGFLRMVRDIEAGRINCVIVKDLSRFGRDYIDMGFYLERWFPARGVRFIAVSDSVDSRDGPYDMLLPLKNIFNAQYAKDISAKVRGSFKTKQRRGEFVGAFACYGYLKDPADHSRLVIDPVAAKTVARIFEMAAKGIGQVRIAKQLNAEGIPCPSEYKRQMGERYNNGRRLESTCYWTYATIHRMLRNEMYLGNMVSARSVRPGMHSKAKAADRSDWIVVAGTHEPIVSRQLWDTVQAQIGKNARPIDFAGNVSRFAGLLFCGDCGRAMCKTTWNGRVTYSCGSYHRYGATACSPHYIREDTLSSIVLEDLNRIVASVPDLRALAKRHRTSPSAAGREHERQRLQTALERVRRLKKSAYEDYRDKLLSRDEFIRYKTDYDRQEADIAERLESAGHDAGPAPAPSWADELVRRGKLTELDRATLVQTVRKIRIFKDRQIEITYLFSEELRPLLESPDSRGVP